MNTKTDELLELAQQQNEYIIALIDVCIDWNKKLKEIIGELSK